MPFGGTFWSTGWEDVKHPHSFPNCTISSSAGTYWKKITVNTYVTSECIQGPMNTYDGTNQSSLNIGYFIGKKTTDSSVVIKIGCCRPDFRAFSADPNLILIKLGSTDSEVNEYRRLTYWAPYAKQVNGNFFCYIRAGSTNTYEIYHVQPIAFRGVVSEVIGAILMHAGFDDSYIDKDSFDEAYDAGLNSGSDNDERPYVWVIPEQGETILATIKRVAQHWSHMLTFNKDGKLAIRPADSIEEFFSALDENANVKSIKTWDDKDLILNSCLAMHSGGLIRYTDYPNAASTDPDFNAEYEPHLKSDVNQEFIDEYSDTTSITKFGERQYGNRVRTTLVEGTGTAYGVGRRGGAGPLVPDIPRTISVFTEGEPIKVAHFPQIHQKAIKDNIMLRFTTN